MSAIFITGGTGYLGRRIIKKLVQQGHDVTALVTKGSEAKLPAGTRAIIADPFDATTFQQWIPRGAVYIQLPEASLLSSRKKQSSQQSHLRSVKASVNAAVHSGVSHFIYVRVAMFESGNGKNGQSVCREGEAYLQSKGLVCTVIRPWYVLGPGHWWPVLLLPLYGIARIVPSWKQKAEQRSLVTLSQMMDTLLKAIASPPQKLRVFEIKHIKRKSLPAI